MSAQPDRVLMRAVAEVVINEEKARAAADRELADRIAALEARPIAKGDANEPLRVPPELAEQIKSLQQLLDEPLPVIAPPEPPQLPRRVTGTMVNRDGELVVTYSDGTSERHGKVVGPRGEQGRDGAPGAVGARGDEGPPGRDGISVVAIARNHFGELMFTLSDGTVLTPIGRDEKAA